MVFDLEMIKGNYAALEARILQAKKIINRPLTSSEKILYAHLWDKSSDKAFQRGVDYVDFGPDRVAMQDATA